MTDRSWSEATPHADIFSSGPTEAQSAHLPVARQDARTARSARAGRAAARRGDLARLRRARARGFRRGAARGRAQRAVSALSRRRASRVAAHPGGLGARGDVEHLRARAESAARRARAGGVLSRGRQLPDRRAHVSRRVLVRAERARRRGGARPRRARCVRALPPARPSCVPRRGGRLLLSEQRGDRRAGVARAPCARGDPRYRHASRPGHPDAVLRSRRRAVRVDSRRSDELLSGRHRLRNGARGGARRGLQREPADAARLARSGVLRAARAREVARRALRAGRAGVRARLRRVSRGPAVEGRGDDRRLRAARRARRRPAGADADRAGRRLSPRDARAQRRRAVSQLRGGALIARA
ncbi:putative acetylpolyamine aminohydrolase [Burkholderia pseudomallei]|nr:putative acetylpolyamine aminohydrolase [Burkholderia pseudomallei]